MKKVNKLLEDSGYVTIKEKEINGNGLYNGYSLFPFGDNSYLTLDEMHEKIKNY